MEGKIYLKGLVHTLLNFLLRKIFFIKIFQIQSFFFVWTINTKVTILYFFLWNDIRHQNVILNVKLLTSFIEKCYICFSFIEFTFWYNEKEKINWRHLIFRKGKARIFFCCIARQLIRHHINIIIAIIAIAELYKMFLKIWVATFFLIIFFLFACHHWLPHS